MEMHFASIWESFADAIGDAPAITQGDITRTWAEYDDRAARLAAAFAAAGLAHDSKIALYLYNSNEYLEAQYGALKVRGVPINVNYRYLDDELRYLLDNADAEAIVFHASLGDRVGRVLDQLPDLKLLIEVDDAPSAGVPGAVRYEQVVAGHDPMGRIARDESDLYMLYTGGTTGMPKGVMYSVGGFTGGLVNAGFPLLGLQPPEDAAELAAIVVGARDQLPSSIPCAPLMHGTGMWIGAMIPGLMGGHVITLSGRSLDPHEVWRTAEAHGVTGLTIVGDSFAKPLVRALDEGGDGGRRYDTSALRTITSSGVMWTAEVKQQLIDRIEQVMLIDAIGSTEGSMGVKVTMKGLDAETAKFDRAPTAKVFDENDQEVQPGSDTVGMVAAGGSVPLGYYKDEAKTAATFPTDPDGVRWSVPGDFATIDDDGIVTLLGRGSQCINTGGEKVYPEEVEEALKSHPDVYDALVVGLPDERWGERVVAVVQPRGDARPTVEEISHHCRQTIAGYKVPRALTFVDAIQRSPAGKADYRWAKAAAGG